KVIGSLIVGTLISALEIAALFSVLSLAIFRRIRHIGSAVDMFGFVAEPVRLSEGLGPPGRDALFNLARSVDRKLQELGQHQRAEEVVTELGRLALEGVDQAQLTSKALEITRKAGDLERCFVVDTGGRVTVIQSSTSGQSETTEAKLPIWLGAL